MSQRSNLLTPALLLLLGSIGLFFSGCAAETKTPLADKPTPSTSPTTPAADIAKSAGKTDAAGEEEHGHVPGAHGGFIVPLGRDSYHVEAIFEKDGVISLYMLGSDESQVFEVENQELTAYVKSASTAEATPIKIKPAPQDGDATGKTSRFTGTLPESLWASPVEITVPSIRIGSDRFRFGFSSVTEQHEGEAMPAKVTSKEEQELYLTPGGIYTQADIEANGSVTASQKFAGFMAAHDLNPKKGNKICPITLTKATPKCSWVVAGKSYEFCCPPCVDEFVKMAKENPDQVKTPEEYVKE